MYEFKRNETLLEPGELGQMNEVTYACHNETNLLVKESAKQQLYKWGKFECNGPDDEGLTTIYLDKADYYGHWTLYFEAHHANIEGMITFVNTNGYLSAVEFPMLAVIPINPLRDCFDVLLDVIVGFGFGCDCDCDCWLWLVIGVGRGCCCLW